MLLTPTLPGIVPAASVEPLHGLAARIHYELMTSATMARSVGLVVRMRDAVANNPNVPAPLRRFAAHPAGPFTSTSSSPSSPSLTCTMLF